jgi:peptidoglycan/LPS O-acetylase OafA/YrhL
MIHHFCFALGPGNGASSSNPRDYFHAPVSLIDNLRQSHSGVRTDSLGESVAPKHSLSSGRIPELDGLRGILAWTVVWSHILICCGWFGPILGGHNVLNETAESAVDIFMLLSGFAITRLLLVERGSWASFFRGRVCRIVPAYWLALAAGIALNGWLGANLRHLPPTVDAQAFAAICDLGAARPWTDGILHFLLLHGLVPGALLPGEPYTFLGVAWSLSLEWQFYCVAPLALILALRTRWGFAILAILACAGAVFCESLISSFSNAFLPVKAAFFLVGAISYVSVMQNKRNDRALLWLAGSCGLLATLWLVGSRKPIESFLPLTVWGIVLLAVRFQCFAHLRLLLDSRPLQYLGRVSYSTYLFHGPVITVVQAAIWRWIRPASQTQLFLETVVPAIVGTLIVSELSWRLVERPFQRLGRGRHQHH